MGSSLAEPSGGDQVAFLLKNKLFMEKIITPKYLLFAKYMLAYMGILTAFSWCINVGWNILIHDKSFAEANTHYSFKISTWLAVSIVLAIIRLRKSQVN
jgi:uncharacterized membrane protein